MIQIDNLSFSYGQKVQLFDQLNLKLPAGNIYGLLGKNGAGKSTLLKLVSGLLFPQFGSLNVLGYRPKDRYPQLLREIYMIGEELYLPSVTINQYVNLYSPFYPRFNSVLFEQYISEFNLLKKQNLSALSYGQKKNFLLSFGLATDCKLMVLDEPTNGLDIPSKSQFRKILANAIDDDKSFIISTHQARDMENLIDPVIILDEGQVVFFQNYEQISKKLIVTKQKEILQSERIIYSESSLGGYTVVKENTTGDETNINLEILFNAVINNKAEVNKIFKS
jgi:ABC-2 type transport system ATP-binding protein